MIDEITRLKVNPTEVERGNITQVVESHLLPNIKNIKNPEISTQNGDKSKSNQDKINSYFYICIQ